MVRVRTITYGDHTGQRTRRLTGGVETRTLAQGQSKCLDFVGYPNDHTLEIQRVSATHPLLNGTQGTVNSGYIYDNYPLGPFGGITPYHLGASSIEPDDVYSATKVASDTNPSNPDVSVPTFVFETVKELPKMLLDAGETMFLPDKRPKRARRENPLPQGDSVVAYNFGWGQLFSDVAKILDFVDLFDKRVTQINALYDKGGLKRNRTVWTSTVGPFIDPSYTLNSQGGLVHARYTVKSEYKKWVAVRWTPLDRINIPSSAEQVEKARYLVHGWRIDPFDIWNALPWSWLVDYFSNVGDFLGACSNTAGNQLSSCCVMLKVTTNESMVITDSASGTTCTNGYRSSVSKYRRLGSIGLTANVPFITPQKLLNLLSIANSYGRGESPLVTG